MKSYFQNNRNEHDLSSPTKGMLAKIEMLSVKLAELSVIEPGERLPDYVTTPCELRNFARDLYSIVKFAEGKVKHHVANRAHRKGK